MNDFRLVIQFLFTQLANIFALVLSNYVLTFALMIAIFSMIVTLMNNTNGKE